MANKIGQILKTGIKQEQGHRQVTRTSAAFRRAFASRDAAAGMASRVESDPLFQHLQALGLLEKKAFLGRVPEDKMQDVRELAERKANEFLKRYGLDTHPALVGAAYEQKKSAEKELQEFAVGMRAPLHELEQALKALREASRERLSADGESLEAREEEGREVSDNMAANEREPVPAVAMDVQKMCARFCALYGVSAGDFETFFLSSDAEAHFTAEEVAEELDCEEQEVRALRAVLAGIHNSSDETDEDEEPVADGTEEDGHCVAKLTLKDNVWVVTPVRQRKRYVVSRGVEEVLDKEQKSRWQALQEEIRALNELADKRVQALDFICRRQRFFLTSGELHDLAPLSQREIAQAIGCAPDRVFRMLFDDSRKDSTKAHRKKSGEEVAVPPPYFLATPRGRVFLRDLLQELDEVVPRIKQKHPSLSDTQIQSYLQKRCNVYRTRQAIQKARARGSAIHSNER